MVSDRRARAGGEMEVPTAANGAVVAAPWEEAAEEHGGRWRFRVWVVRWREWGNHPRVNKKLFPAILFPILSSKIGVISLGGSPLEQI